MKFLPLLDVEMGLVQIFAEFVLSVLTLTPSLSPSHSSLTLTVSVLLTIGAVNISDDCEGEGDGSV